MGIKDWLAKKSGPAGYAGAFASKMIEGGIALGRTLYLSHGVRPGGPGAFVFEDGEAMKAAGFVLYCPDPLNQPALEDSSELSRQARIAGLAFASQCAISAASNYMKSPNAHVFNRSLGGTVKTEVSHRNLPFPVDDVMDYLRLAGGEGMKRVLNLDRPGEDDLLFVILEKVARSSDSGAVAFCRGGVTGFDTLAVPLASETVLLIKEASERFGW